jgi:hypothetical protein
LFTWFLALEWLDLLTRLVDICWLSNKESHMWSKVHKSLDPKQEMLSQKYLKKQSRAPQNVASSGRISEIPEFGSTIRRNGHLKMTHWKLAIEFEQHPNLFKKELICLVLHTQLIYEILFMDWRCTQTRSSKLLLVAIPILMNDVDLKPSYVPIVTVEMSLHILNINVFKRKREGKRAKSLGSLWI